MKRTIVFFAADLAEAVQESRHPAATQLPGPSVQDQREKRDPVNHGPFHQLCHRNNSPFGQAARTLDPTGRGVTLSA